MKASRTTRPYMFSTKLDIYEATDILGVDEMEKVMDFLSIDVSKIECKVTSLEGCPKKIGESKVTSLEGMPENLSEVLERKGYEMFGDCLEQLISTFDKD